MLYQFLTMPFRRLAQWCFFTLQSLSTSKTWASSAGAEAEEAPHALTYKVEIYTGDVRGAGTHVRT